MICALYNVHWLLTSTSLAEDTHVCYVIFLCYMVQIDSERFFSSLSSSPVQFWGVTYLFRCYYARIISFNIYRLSVDDARANQIHSPNEWALSMAYVQCYSNTIAEITNALNLLHECVSMRLWDVCVCIQLIHKLLLSFFIHFECIHFLFSSPSLVRFHFIDCRFYLPLFSLILWDRESCSRLTFPWW